MSDKGQRFVGAEFKEFLSCNEIKHLKSAAYHPASNGLCTGVADQAHSKLYQ